MFNKAGTRKTVTSLPYFTGLFISLAIIFTMLAGPGIVAADDPGFGSAAPPNPAFVEYMQNRQKLQYGQNVQEAAGQPFYGRIPSPKDLSHLERIPVQSGADTKSAVEPRGAPASFDWRTTGKVTPVKDQSTCGTCWAFGNTAVVESRAIIQFGLSNSIDYSEQNLDTCTDPSVAYLVGNRCDGGGWDEIAQDTFTKKGARLESCQPYNIVTINTAPCNNTCVTQYLTTDWRYVAPNDTTVANRTAIKNAIQNYGPVTVSFCVGPYMSSGNIYYWPACTSCPEGQSHLVSIIGWDDNLAHPAGGGYGAWLVKNSWGSTWGNAGYFWLCYGAGGGAGDFGSVQTVKAYDPNEKIYSWDEAGPVGAYGWGDTTGWMASKFTTTAAGSLTNVDFWTTSNNASYIINVYNGSFGALLATKSGTCAEYGYYSIPLTTPVALTNGQPFTVAVKMTTPGFYRPIPVEFFYSQDGTTYFNPTIQTGKCYARHLDGGTWYDIGGGGTQLYNVNLRARVSPSHMAPVSGFWWSIVYGRIGAFSNGTWYLDATGDGIWNGTSGLDKLYSFGDGTMTPVTGDWNHDGITEVGAYKAGIWYLDYDGSGHWDGATIDRQYTFGNASMKPVTGDWNSDGWSEIGTFLNGTWYLDYNRNGVWNGVAGGDRQYTFGNGTMTPVTGNWNGTGGTEIGTYLNGIWYLDLNGNGVWNGTAGGDRQYTFGNGTMTPITGRWNGQGGTKIGTYLNGTWYLDYNGNGAWNGNGTGPTNDRQYTFGN